MSFDTEACGARIRELRKGNELTRRYVNLKQNVKHTTRAGYKTILKILYNDPFGSRRIDKVRTMDAKAWLVKLQQEEYRGYSSIQTIRGVLRPAFAMAVEDDLLVKNPFDFMLCDVIVNDSVRREAITAAQMREFLRFVQEDKHFSRYYDGIYILFHTGMRISEFCGLTIQDIDLDRRTINIDHQLQRTSDMQYIIVDSAKTDAGTRILPMEDDVYECFSRILEERKKPKVEPMVDGRIGFLYMDKNGMPMVAMHWEKYFQHITEKYNKIYRVQMPKVTPHVCRHTYCSEKAKKGMNPNTLKYLMGAACPLARVKHRPSRQTRPYGYRRHAEYLHASGADRCRAGAGAHEERSQNERPDRAQKAAQEVGWVIGQEVKTVKPLKSNVDKTRFLTHFRGRFINILSTLKSKICKEMPVYAGFQ